MRAGRPRWLPVGWLRSSSAAAGHGLAFSRAAVTRGRQWVTANTLEPAWLAPRRRHPAIGYVCAAAGQVLAAGLTIALLAWFPTIGFRSALFLLVTVVIALSFGAGPSLLAALLGAALADYIVISPHYTFSFRTPSDFASFGLYLAVGIAISVLSSQVARARHQAELARAEAIRAEGEATGRAEQLQTTFDAMGDALALYDADLRLVKRNAAFDNLFGFDDDPAMLERTIEGRYAESVIQDEHGEAVPLDQLPQVRALRGEVFVGDRAVDLRVRTRTGRALDVNLTAAPVRDAGGRIVGAVAMFRDVTERRRLEQRTHEALAALLEMAQVLVTASPEADGQPSGAGASGAEEGGAAQAATADAIPPARQAAQRLAGLIRSVLGCARVAITEVDPVSERMHPLAVVGLTPEQEAHMWATWPENARLGDSVHQEEIARLRAGGILTANLGDAALDAPRNPYRARAVLVAPGLLRGQLVCMLTTDYGSEPHDYSPQEQALTGAVTQLVALVIEREQLVRERAQAEARELALQAARDRMDQFLSLASHELRTPLTTMKTNVQMARRRAGRLVVNGSPANAPATRGEEDAQREIATLEDMLKRAEKALVRQERLVNDLLDVSRIESGRLEHYVTQVDLAALIRDTVEEQRLAHPDRVVTLTQPGGPVWVQADGDRIRQVLANYLINALRYAPVDRPVAVSLSVDGNASVARVSVRDEGPGIAADERERIWERFHRVPGVTHTSGSGVGLGLGLFISREIVERHGGQVGVESAEGKGSEFWFTLPMGTEAAE